MNIQFYSVVFVDKFPLKIYNGFAIYYSQIVYLLRK